MHKIAQSAGCGLAPLPRTCRARVAGLRGGARGGARQQLQQCYCALRPRAGRECGVGAATSARSRASRAACRRAAAVMKMIV